MLVAGGNGTVLGSPLASAELYDPDQRYLVRHGEMVGPRGGHTATRLPDGTVLVAGGDNPVCTGYN